MEEIQSQEQTSVQKCDDSEEMTTTDSGITIDERLKESLQKVAELIEIECLDPECLDWVEIDELKDLGFGETGLNQLFQLSKATYPKDSFQQIPSFSGSISGMNHLYGELITIGYRSYQVSSSQDPIPVGTANDVFRLQFKQIHAEESSQTSATIIIKPNMVMSNKNYYPAVGASEARSRPEYDPRKVDVYQLGRSECGANDWVLRGLLGEADSGQGRHKRGSVSRYSCRIVCNKEPPYNCHIFAGAFDRSQELKLPRHSLQWKEDGNVYDGLTATGIRLWHPIQKKWSEVSVRGKMFGPRKSLDISEKFKFVPGERLFNITNALIDGAIIDLGGCMLLFKCPIPSGSATDVSIRNMIKNINEHHPQCPVLFQPLLFSEISLKDKQHRLWDYLKAAHHRPNCSRKTMAPEFFSEGSNTLQSSTPYVFSSCGHVYGYSKELEGRSCPMCRKTGPYIPLILPSKTSICSKKPTHVFNPCGHAASFRVCQQWSEIPLPDITKSSEAKTSPCCPYCLTSDHQSIVRWLSSVFCTFDSFPPLSPKVLRATAESNRTEALQMQAEITFLQNELIRLTNEFQELQAHTVSDHRKLSEYDQGEVAIILASTSLVIFMTLPGIALFYSGGVKIKHVLTTFIQTMSIVAVVTCLWMIFGYSLAFAPAHGELNSASVFGDTSRFWLHGMRIDSAHIAAPHIPESTFCLFHLTNAILACSLIVGPFSCRAKYLPLLTFMGLWLLLVYCPLTHMLNHPEGFLYKADVLDFAGGLTVHVAPGIAAYVCANLLGSIDDTEERFESRNMLLAVWGACFLWIGWFGFNVGSAVVGGSSLGGETLIITMIGATSAAISWTAVEWSTTPHPSILGMLSGAISGLIALSPCVGYVDQTGAFIIGIIAGFFCYAGSDYRDLKKLDKTLKFEDLMGTFTLNFIGGVVGSFLLGFFANNRNGKLDFQNGAFYGNPEQIYLQIYGIVISTCWSAVGTVVIFFVVDKLCGGIRVDKIYEEVGLDIAQLGVTVVAMPKNKLDREIQRVLDFENGRNRPEDADLDVGNHGNEKREAGGDDMDEQGPSILM